MNPMKLLMLKLLAYKVSPCLALLFSASLQQSIVPSDWEKASVCPIFKEETEKNATNYRPVSLTSVCSKIMEHVVYGSFHAKPTKRILIPFNFHEIWYKHGPH